jgi:hypothetical protein
MGTDKQRLKDPATARAFIRNLANRFEDPERMSEFLRACDLAQAALACLLFEENRYDHIQQTHCTRGVYTEMESQVERETVWNEYNEASAEFQLVKERLKKIISELDM